MSWRFYLGVYAAALAVYLVVAWPHTHPVSIDSFYYVDIARSLGWGRGFTEGFAWNYLSGEPTLPHPSSEYWLPGFSILLAPAYLVGVGYPGVEVITAACAACSPLLAAVIARTLFPTHRHAVVAAALVTFNGIWFHDWTTPDAFVPAAALTTATLLLCGAALEKRGPRDGAVLFALAGAFAALAALTRQEGVLLPAAALLALLLARPLWSRRLAWGLVGAVVLYAVVQAPWVLHNLAVLGAPGASGGTGTLWMRSYNQFYFLHTASLTFGTYLSWGLNNIVAAKLHALTFTLSIWAALWLVVLVPPLLAGVWTLRRRVLLRPFFCYWAILALALPLVFTATIENGTLLHASGGLLPCAAVLVAAGLETIGRGLAALHYKEMAEQRAARARRLTRGMSVLAVTIAAVVSIYFARRTFPVGGDEYTHTVPVAAWLRLHNTSHAPAMVYDPAAYAYVDDGAYVIAPSDGLLAVRQVLHHYRVRYWALTPQDAPNFTAARHVAWLHWTATVEDVRIYRVEGA